MVAQNIAAIGTLAAEARCKGAESFATTTFAIEIIAADSISVNFPIKFKKFFLLRASFKISFSI